jgi:hypothetical protein
MYLMLLQSLFLRIHAIHIKMVLSEVGFEPKHSVEDQNASIRCARQVYTLESGDLDRSAILTHLALRLTDLY